MKFSITINKFGGLYHAILKITQGTAVSVLAPTDSNLTIFTSDGFGQIVEEEEIIHELTRDTLLEIQAQTSVLILGTSQNRVLSLLLTSSSEIEIENFVEEK